MTILALERELLLLLQFPDTDWQAQQVQIGATFSVVINCEEK